MLRTVQPTRAHCMILCMHITKIPPGRVMGPGRVAPRLWLRQAGMWRWIWDVAPVSLFFFLHVVSAGSRPGREEYRYFMFYVFGLNNPATTGQATTALTGFDRVIGIDPSESMIQKARAGSTAVLTTTTTTTPAPAAKSANASSAPRISFLNHAAEDLDFIDDASIDLVISGSLQTSLFVTTPHHAFIIIIIIIIFTRSTSSTLVRLYALMATTCQSSQA